VAEQNPRDPEAVVSICEITLNPRTGLFGYNIYFEGRPPHDKGDTFTCRENVLHWVDPHSERIWEPSGDTFSRIIMISRAYRPGTVMDRMSRWRPGTRKR
jgi:hypothetical protein